MNPEYCACGCVNEPKQNVEGHCMWCDHVYRLGSSQDRRFWVVVPHDESEDLHFAEWCPNAPEELREMARKRRLKA